MNGAILAYIVKHTGVQKYACNSDLYRDWQDEDIGGAVFHIHGIHLLSRG